MSIKNPEELSPFQEAQLKFFRRQVDNLIEEQLCRDPRPNLDREIFSAREELDQYVKGLREIGKLI